MTVRAGSESRTWGEIAETVSSGVIASHSGTTGSSSTACLVRATERRLVEQGAAHHEADRYDRGSRRDGLLGLAATARPTVDRSQTFRRAACSKALRSRRARWLPIPRFCAVQPHRPTELFQEEGTVPVPHKRTEEQGAYLVSGRSAVRISSLAPCDRPGPSGVGLRGGHGGMSASYGHESYSIPRSEVDHGDATHTG